MSCFQAQTTTIFEEFSDLSRNHAGRFIVRIDLTDAEIERLAEILDFGFSPTPALREVLSRLADPKRHPPRLKWNETET